MLSVNELAYSLVEDMLDYREDYEEEYRIAFHRLKNGAWVLDFGVNVRGSLSAGILFSEVCMAGLGEIDIRAGEVKAEGRDVVLPFVEVKTDRPALACIASQKAGWRIKVGDYFAMGSGPARALALKPKKTYEELEYEDDAEYAVIALESDTLPDEKVIDYIARECDVESEDVYALVAPTASITGSVQISARVVETALYRLSELGIDVRKVISGCGKAPVAPVMKDSLRAMGVTNDCLLYYGSVFLYTDFSDEEFSKLSGLPLTSCHSSSYGKPFYDIFREAGYDFYRIDKNLFSPAKLTVSNLNGELIESGKLNGQVLLKSFGLS